MSGEKNPVISIIVPSYNEEKYVSRCLDSILNQTFTDFEVICVDDNSTDSTFEIIKEYAKKDSRIVPMKNPGKGVSSARNFGLDHVRGEYIGFVDSDDFIQPQMYEFLYRAIKENNCDIVLCNYENISEITAKTFDYSASLCKIEELVHGQEMILASVCLNLIKKSLISDDIRFSEFKLGEDTVFSSKLFKKTDKIAFIDLPLYLYYFNPDSAIHAKPDDAKWLDFIETRLISSKILMNSNEIVSTYYLKIGIRLISSFRFDTKKSKYRKSINKKLKSLYFDYISYFLSNKRISVKNKISDIIFYFFPFIYDIFRKIMDRGL